MPTIKTRQQIIDELPLSGSLSYNDFIDLLYSIFFFEDDGQPSGVYLSRLTGTWNTTDRDNGRYVTDYFVSYNESIYRSSVDNNVSTPGSSTTWLIQNNDLSDTVSFKGLATTTTNPGTPVSPEYWIANAPGTYTYFKDAGNASIVIPAPAAGQVLLNSFLISNGSFFIASYQIVTLPVVDLTPYALKSITDPITNNVAFNTGVFSVGDDPNPAKYIESINGNKVLQYIDSTEIMRVQIPTEGNINREILDRAKSDNIPNAYIVTDSNGLVIFQLVNDKTLIPNLLIPQLNLTMEQAFGQYVPISRLEICTTGDSLTEGAGSTSEANTYPSKLAIKLGRKVTKWAIGGQNSERIAKRYSAYPIFYTLASNTFSGGGATVATPIGLDILKNDQNRSVLGWFYPNGASLGYYGTLTRIGDTVSPNAGQTTFLPGGLFADITITTPANGYVKFIPDNLSLKQRTTIIWIGRNDVVTYGVNLGTEVERRAKDIINTTTALKTNYIVCSITNGFYNGVSEVIGTTPYNDIYAANAYLQRVFGRRFFDGLALMPKDANGLIQNAYMSTDFLHFSDSGYDLWATNLAQFMVDNGF